MQQRQLRLGDILDDYCPRERRVTNHAVVAMIGDEVKQTRCTTCDADHEYKHARIPRQRRKADTPAALYTQVAAAAPKRVVHEAHAGAPEQAGIEHADVPVAEESIESEPLLAEAEAFEPLDTDHPDTDAGEGDAAGVEERDAQPTEFESVHRPLIRATLPRHDGQQPVQRQAPDFTIRQPGGRPGRFRPRNQRGQAFGANGNRAGGNYSQSMRGPQRHPGGRPQGGNVGRPGRHRQGPPSGKRSK
jgi:hypothetical protein